MNTKNLTPNDMLRKMFRALKVAYSTENTLKWYASDPTRTSDQGQRAKAALDEISKIKKLALEDTTPYRT